MFLAVGIFNTFVGLGFIYLFKWLFSMGDVAANAVGYAIGLSVSFLLNRTWTFRHQGRVTTAFARFLLVIAVAYLSNLAIVLTAIEVFAINDYVSQALGIPPYTLLVYFGAKFFAFRDG